ncbi:hypothetical protein [Rothia sp. ZJ932]|uniref:hypothetical protein n=1 Tax=Rothia sp. ZJ932 TaxID=2810516 RepID=UPI001967615B|nr:hypothetical protein [Rothia sp. ZJ932]QRZ60812.1 hypothetical protein JR346_05825 [Rothia sp. ZJ932]
MLYATIKGDKLEIGSVADWVSGLASAVAAGTAMYFWYKDRRERNSEERTNISVWVQAAEGANEWEIISINNASNPIWKWALFIKYPTADGAYTLELVDSTDGGIIPPGQHIFPWSPSGLISNESDVRYELFFVDSIGKHWKKTLSGGLEAVKDIDLEIKKVSHAN